MSKTFRAEKTFVRQPITDHGDHWTRNGWNVALHLEMEALDREEYEPLDTASEALVDDETLLNTRSYEFPG